MQPNFALASIARLQSNFPNEKLFDTLVAFGRYAEILSYNAKLGVLNLPAPEPPEMDLGDDDLMNDG